MNAQVCGHVFKPGSKMPYSPVNGVLLLWLCCTFPFRFGQPKHLGQFAQGSTLLKGLVGGYQCRMPRRIFLKQIAKNGIAVLPRKIQIKVGGIGSVWVYKALKIQVQFNGVNIGNA